MKSKILHICLLLIYTTAYLFFYHMYFPKIAIAQAVFIPIIIAIIVITALSLEYGTLTILFLLPIVNSVFHLLHLNGINPLLIIFYGYFMGILIGWIRKPNTFTAKHPIFLPVWASIAVLSLSALITFWRYSNFFPLYDSTVRDLAVNIFNVSTGEAIRRLILDYSTYMAGFIWFVAILNVMKNRKCIERAIGVLAFSSIISFSFGLYQSLGDSSLGNSDFWISQNRINALFSDPNALGAYLLLCFPLFIGSMFASATKKKYLYLLAAIGAVFILPSSGSITGLLGIFLAVLFFCLLLWIRKNTQKTTQVLSPKKIIISTSIIGVIFAFLVCLVLISRGGSLYQRLTRSIQTLSQPKALQMASDGRTVYWRTGFHMMRKYPLSGVGIGSFVIDLPNFYKEYAILPIESSFYQEYRPEVAFVDTAGNLYLHVAFEIGLIGLILFGWIFYLILRKIMLQNGSWNRDSSNFYAKIGISSGILAMFIMFLTGAHTLHFEIQLAFWFLVGLLFTYEPSPKGPLRKNSTTTRVLVAVIFVFAACHTWNSLHSLSLQERTRRFNLPQTFGFYQNESAAGREFRWTGKSAGITCKVEKPLLIIPIQASHPDIHQNPVLVDIFLTRNLLKEKELLASIELKMPAWQYFRYDLTRELGSEVMIVFRVSRIWQPHKELGTTDKRKLGIAVGKIHFEDLPE
ncbi:O-antigen ligase family protein [Acidobacteriota bacterium]